MRRHAEGVLFAQVIHAGGVLFAQVIHAGGVLFAQRPRAPCTRPWIASRRARNDGIRVIAKATNKQRYKS